MLDHYEPVSDIAIEETSQNRDVKRLQNQYKEAVLKEIERINNYEKSYNHESKCG